MTAPSLQASLTSVQTLTTSLPSSMILDKELSKSFAARRPMDTTGLDILKRFERRRHAEFDVSLRSQFPTSKVVRAYKRI